MKEVELSPEDLLALVTEDNQRAFTLFYHLFYKKVFRFAFYYLKNEDASADVVSEVFFTVWKSRKSLGEIKTIDAYLYVVTKNKALHYLQQHKKYREVTLEEIPLRLEQSTEESAEKQLEEKEIEELISRIVNGLPEKCRMIFLMNRQEGLKTKEIAEALSLSESTVRVQMKIAVDRIVAELKR